MAGNTFGKLFCVTTAGESHGAALVAIVDGVPPGIALTEADLQCDLDRRKPGASKFTTQRKEDDQVSILSGVFEGVTTGTPIALVIHNKDQKSKDYQKVKDTFRPGHADYTYLMKYGRRDHRGGGRASARETAMRVAAGAIAKKFLASFGILVRAHVIQIGDVYAKRSDSIDWQTVADNAFFCADANAVPQFEALIERTRKEGTSVGARLEVVAQGVMAGLGEPIFDRLDADLAHALMGINAVKAVEIGMGVEAAASFGHQVCDELSPSGFLSNHAGGILGGISSGQPICARIALKPTPSITTPRRSIDTQGKAVEMRTTGRHDPCVGIRAVPIAEAMVALVLADHLMRHRAQNADVTVPLSPIA